MPIQLTDLPEELLERILAEALAPSASVWSSSSSTSTNPPPHLFPRSSSAPLARAPSASVSASSTRRPLVPFTTTIRAPVPSYAPLLVCARFHRIGAPLLYSSLDLTTPAQTRLAVRALKARPQMAACVRSVRVEGVWGGVWDLVQVLASPYPSYSASSSGSSGSSRSASRSRRAEAYRPRLESFDFLMDFVTPPGANAPNGIDVSHGGQVGQFCAALALLSKLGSVRHLTVRKASSSYLNTRGPAYVLDWLGSVVEGWDSLETVDVAFRLPSGPPVTATNLANAFAQLQPVAPVNNLNANFNANQQANASSTAACTRFVSALARAPGLKVVHAHLPAVWNTALLEISTNPSLKAVVLTPSPLEAGAGLFLKTARKYERLFGLIQAGIPVAPPAPTTRPHSSSYSHSSSNTNVHSSTRPSSASVSAVRGSGGTRPPLSRSAGMARLSANGKGRSTQAASVEVDAQANAAEHEGTVGRMRANTTISLKSGVPFPSVSKSAQSSSYASSSYPTPASCPVSDTEGPAPEAGPSGHQLTRSQSKKAKKRERAARRVSVV